MEDSNEFLGLILDSITEHIAVIDEQGDIRFVNQSWSTFGSQNECSTSHDWRTSNYIFVCDCAAKMGDEFGVLAVEGIKSVIEQKTEQFSLEYPCHSVDEKRWFIMRVSPFELSNERFFVISHQNVTERKLAEEAVDKLAKLDGLTDIYNRRAFDEFLSEQWDLCARLDQPISLAMIDLDHFKLLNDTYGHQVGDDCLMTIGALLNTFACRPGDLCARYGGEEFALIWANTPLLEAEVLTMQVLDKIRGLKIPNQDSSIAPYMTASIGLVEMMPSPEVDARELVAQADLLLYKAKAKGRNTVEIMNGRPDFATKHEG